jgi:hypothetical protein
VVVDIPLLISNLEGVERSDWESADKSLAAEVIKRLIHIVSTVSPGAKLGSTAPYSYAQCLLAEAGNAQPRTLANAFQQPVSKNSNGVLANSYHALGSYTRIWIKCMETARTENWRLRGQRNHYLSRWDWRMFHPYRKSLTGQQTK